MVQRSVRESGGENVDEKSLLRTISVAFSCYMSLNMLIKIHSMVNESDGMEN
jgi:hypothetical protein